MPRALRNRLFRNSALIAYGPGLQKAAVSSKCRKPER